VIPSPRQRLLAGLIDAFLMGVWAAFAGILVWLAAVAGVPPGTGLLGYNVIALLLVVLPVTLALTALEAGVFEATPGKLRVGLRVRVAGSGARIGHLRSLARNLLKLGLPWTLAHLAVLALVTAPAADAAAGALIAVIVPASYVVSLFVGSGRTPYDWLTGTVVIATAPGRRVAAPADEDEAAPPEQPGSSR
jgi:uncharacterized RDD family membrane protein YckC